MDVRLMSVWFTGCGLLYLSRLKMGTFKARIFSEYCTSASMHGLLSLLMAVKASASEINTSFATVFTWWTGFGCPEFFGF